MPRTSSSKSSRKNSPNTIKSQAINLGHYSKVKSPEMSQKSIDKMISNKHYNEVKEFNKGKRLSGQKGPIASVLERQDYIDRVNNQKKTYYHNEQRNRFLMGMHNTHGIGGPGLQLSPQKQIPRTPPHRKTTKNKSNQNARVPNNKSNEDNDPIFGVFNRLTHNIYSPNKGGKSKTKSCCSVRKSAKVCRRKTDNKKFRLPRRFSRKTCLAKKTRGFTMRSSCAPYKGCKKTRKNKKGGRMRRINQLESVINRLNSPFELLQNVVTNNDNNRLDQIAEDIRRGNIIADPNLDLSDLSSEGSNGSTSSNTSEQLINVILQANRRNRNSDNEDQEPPRQRARITR